MNVDHENTIRALADRTLIQTNMRCNFGFHMWEQWSKPYVPKNGYQNIQHRYCASCNIIRLRKVSHP